MIKIYQLVISLFFILIPLTTFAGWEVAKPGQSIPREPFFQTGSQTRKMDRPSAYGSEVFPNQYASLGSSPFYAISISGSLKENIERIMNGYHWRVVWKAPYDYNFDGRVTGSNLPNVVEKLLKPFPLKAVMYVSNRTLTIVPRSNV